MALIVSGVTGYSCKSEVLTDPHHHKQLLADQVLEEWLKITLPWTLGDRVSEDSSIRDGIQGGAMLRGDHI